MARERKLDLNRAVRSIESHLNYCDQLVDEIVRLRQENLDLKRCIDQWGARVRAAKILPTITHHETDED
jgi:hypothetical protein